MSTGISFNGSKWVVNIYLKSKHIYLGSFDTEELAGIAYDKAKSGKIAKIKVIPARKLPIYMEWPDGGKYVIVYWIERWEKWYAQIWINGEFRKIGMFELKKIALAAYFAAENGDFYYSGKIDGRTLRYKT